jgi:hypothetical protein
VDEVAWTDRLLTTIRFLEDAKAVNALIIICGLKQSYVHEHLYYESTSSLRALDGLLCLTGMCKRASIIMWVSEDVTLSLF